jgi:hypothetical protein
MHEKHKHFNMNMNDHSTQTIPYLPAYHTHFFPKINMKHGRCVSYAGFVVMPPSTSNINSQVVQEYWYLSCMVIHIHVRNFQKLDSYGSSVVHFRIHGVFVVKCRLL